MIVTRVPLPPLYEQAFSSDTKSLLGTTLAMLHCIPDHATFEIVSLYEKCKTIQLGRFILGSTGSRHKTAAIVQIYSLTDSEFRIAEVEYYFKVYVKVTTDSCVDTKTFWFASVSLFERYNCKVWFGNPTQVWSRLTTPDTV